MIEKILSKVTRDGEYSILTEEEGYILETIDADGNVHNPILEEDTIEYSEKGRKNVKKRQ